MLNGRLTMFILVAGVMSVSLTEAHWQSGEMPAIDCGSLTVTSPLPPSSASLQRLPISFLPALTENKGRSKHVVGAFQCALKVCDVNDVVRQHVKCYYIRSQPSKLLRHLLRIIDETRCSGMAERLRCRVRYSFGQKWKIGTGRQYFTDIIGLFNHCEIIENLSHSAKTQN